MKKYLIISVGLSSCIAMASSAQAQIQPGAVESSPPEEAVEPSSNGDIVVTAQRRSERLQDVPMAITAFGGEALERAPITNLIDIQTSVPNLNISPRIGSGVVAIRGIGFGIATAGAEGSVALHSDGVYQSRPFAALFSLFDVDRIEVARGPQGTLYGRNATGGAINIISKKPTATLSGYVDSSYGNYNDLAVEGAISGPLKGEVLLVRIAARLQERDGFGTNLTSGSEIDDLKAKAVRGMLEFRPTDSLSFILQGDYFKRDDAAGATHFGGCLQDCSTNAAVSRGWAIPSDPRDVFSDIRQENFAEDYGFLLKSEMELPSADLISLTSYRRGSMANVFDLDGAAQPEGRNSREEDYETFSQELQIAHKGRSLDWIFGIYYFHEKNYARARGHFPPFLAAIAGDYFQGGTLATNAYAAFGEVSYHITPKLALTLGGRYSKERKRISEEYIYLNGPLGVVTGRQASPTSAAPCTLCLGLPDRVSFNAFSPKFSARYELSGNQQIYASVQKGFKSGGFAVGAVTPSFKPETIWSYEAGLKATWFDRALMTNLAVYHYDYRDLQLGQALTTSTVVTNAARAKIDGVELEWRVALDNHLSFDGFGTYNHARFSSYNSRNPGIAGSPILDLSGNFLPNAPKWSGKIGAQYEAMAFAGSVTLRTELFASARVYFSEFNNAVNSQRPYRLVNASIRYEGPNDWNLGIYVNNIFDRTVVAGAVVFTPLVGAFINRQYLPPRTYGIRLGKKF